MSKLKAHLIASASIVTVLLIMLGIVYMPEIVGWCLLGFVGVVVYGAIYGMLTDTGESNDRGC